MTEQIPFHLQANIPIGIYRLDAEDKIVFANQSWLDLHGYKTLEKVRGRHIRIVYAHADEANAVRSTLISTESIQDRVIRAQRANGEEFWASLYAAALFAPDGAYVGREGIVRDVTAREIHRKIAHALPAGYYSVEDVDGVEKLTYCNAEFAAMFGFASQQAAVGYDVASLYRHQADYENFRVRIAREKSRSIRYRELEVKSIRGDSFWVETSINLEYDERDQYVGRIGIVRDLSKDQPLQKLRSDLGNVLHSYTTGLIAIKSDIDAAVVALGPNPFPQVPSISAELLLETLQGPANSISKSLARLTERLTDRNSALRTHFAELVDRFETAQQQHEAFRAQVLYNTAKEIVDACQAALASRNVPREPLKQTRQSASELMRIFAVARLHERTSDVLQMEHEIRSLRAYITTPSQSAQRHRTDVKLWTVVEQAMANLHEFAASRGVTFKPAPRPSWAYVHVDERDILRVITNLLHNAIKYSWSRETGTWIDISLRRQENQLLLEIWNFGLPIPEDELESGLIYEFGYRSRLSTDRGRVGTGIGLADATQTLKHYGGSVKLQSRPASPGGRAEELDPYLTSAIVTVPIKE